MPKSIRIDNGAPMADPQRKRLPVLALWLIGLGIEVIFNRPRRPTDNAKVERMQQTTKNWADIKNCLDSEQLQKQLDQAIEFQRSTYKVRRLNNLTRMERYPTILDNSRTYDESKFDDQLIYQHLAKWQFVRQIGKSGQFSLYGQVYYLGKSFAKQFVVIALDSETKEWKVSDSNGILLKNISAKNMDKVNLWNLTICQRTKLRKAQS